MLNDLQRLLVRALMCADPSAELGRASDHDGLTPAEAKLLQAIDPDALKVTRRIVRKLRLQRLASDPEISAQMDDEPERFRKLFIQYDANVPPRSTFAEDELRTFRQYCARTKSTSHPR